MPATTHAAPTPPGRLPGLGHALQFRLRPLDFLTSLRSYGPVTTVYFGPMKTIFLNTAALVAQLLVTEADRFDKGVQFENFRLLVGDSLSVISGAENHRRRRRIVQPAFQHSRVAGYASVMRDIAADRIGQWRHGEALDVGAQMKELTFEVAAKTLFSAEVGCRAVTEVSRSLPIVTDGITARVLDPTGLYRRLPTPTNRRFNAAIRRLRAISNQTLLDYRDSAVDHGDLLSILMRSRDEESGDLLTDQQIQDEAIGMLVSGTETSTTALSWLFHLLGEHPEVERRVQQEVDEVFGDGPIGIAELGRLEYTDRVIQESFRIHPVGWLLSRRALTAVAFGDVVVQPGQAVMFSPYAIHHDPEVYAEPERFDPDRWLPGRTEPPRGGFLQFGFGSRGCIGERFARLEILITLATAVRRWRLRPVAGQRMRPKLSLTLIPDRLLMTAERRQIRQVSHRT